MKKSVLIVALCYAFLLTACGDSTDENSHNEMKTAVITENSQATEETTTTTFETENENTPVEEINDNNSEEELNNDESYEYLKLLDSEYKNGQIHIGYGLDWSKPGFTQSGKLIFEAEYKVYTYDLDTKELKCIDPRPEELITEWYYFNDKIYFFFLGDSCVISNENGELLKEIDEKISIPLGFFDLGNDRMAFVDLKQNDRFRISDTMFENNEAISVFPQKEIEHGLTEDLWFEILGSYNGKLYVATSDKDKNYNGKIYYYDPDSRSWNETNTQIHYEGSGFSSQLVGKYIITQKTNSNCQIYDMEKDEIVAEINPDARMTSYYSGGEYVTHLYKGNWYKVRFPNGGDIIYYDDYETLGTEDGKGTIVRIDDTYYLKLDDYGVFLRTYENGEENEETIILYEH